MAIDNDFVEKLIKQYVSDSPQNRFQNSGGSPIFNELLVGFADGDDSIFQDYKTIIGDFHFTPREFLEKHAQLQGKTIFTQPAHVAVIIAVFPIAYETRISQHKETVLPSILWNRTKVEGDPLMKEVSLFLVSTLEKLGYQAVAPTYSPLFKQVESTDGPSSNWSQRHAAYAAGLGTFSLSDGFITPCGIAHRLSSVISDVSLTTTPRKYVSHLANCLFFRGNSCGLCIKRCPAGAISKKGHDKRKCQNYQNNEQRLVVEKLGRTKDYIGRIGCGLCMTKVPCESGIPQTGPETILNE